MARLLVLGEWLLADTSSPPLPDAGVLVDASQIVAAGPAADLCAAYPGAEVLRAPDRAIVPGFVNTHHHMYGVLAHGLPLEQAPAGFWPFLRDFWWPRVEDALTHELITAAVDWACLEMVRSGITTFYDCLEAPSALPGALDMEAAVLRRWGLRGILSFEATQRRGEAIAELGLQENVRFIDSTRSQDGLISGLMCYHTTFTCSPDYIRRAFALAADRGVSVHMHLSEGTYEPEYCLRTYGVRPIEHYRRLGVLGPAMLASQCVQVTAAELDLLAEAGARVSHMPLSNCEVGGGFAPVPEMLSRGITVGLGTDGYINNFFEVMRGAFFMPKARLQDPTVMPAATVWRMATEDGAQALGLTRVGRLQPGYAADLLLIRTDLPTPLSPSNLCDQLLLWRNPEDITDVMASGVWLKRNGRVLGSDEAAIRERCRAAARKLWEASLG